MIYRALRFLSSEVRGLHAAVFVLAFSALLSSILALLRDRLLAHTFGASATLDLYYAAFRIPDLIFVAVGALVSVYILIPELAKRSNTSQKEYLDTIIAGFSLCASAVALLAVVLAPALLRLLFPKIVAAGSLDTLVDLTRIMLLQPIFLGLSNIFAAVTQSRNRYMLYPLSYEGNAKDAQLL
jgi:putative peptidoglycan lipid II flippase